MKKNTIEKHEKTKKSFTFAQRFVHPLIIIYINYNRQMFIDFFYFTPVLVCFVWAITYMAKTKTTRQKVLLACLIVGMLYFVSYAFFTIPDTNYLQMTILESISLPMALLTTAAISIYADMLIENKKVSPWHMLHALPAVIYFASSGTVYYILGYDNLAKFKEQYDQANEIPAAYIGDKTYEAYVIITDYLLVLFALYFIILIISQCIYAINVHGYRAGDFFRLVLGKKKEDSVIKISYSLIAVMLLIVPVTVIDVYVMNHPALGVFLALAISVAIHFLAFHEHNSGIKKQAASIESATIPEPTPPEVLTEAIVTLRERRALTTIETFRHIMEEEKAYLDNEITIGKISERLGVGQTTLSTIIRKEYDKNFRSVINDYRIQFAKDYMRENPSAIQADVALASGYNDVTTYNHKFKEITGKSPLVWLLEEGKKATPEDGKNTTE